MYRLNAENRGRWWKAGAFWQGRKDTSTSAGANFGDESSQMISVSSFKISDKSDKEVQIVLYFDRIHFNTKKLDLNFHYSIKH